MNSESNSSALLSNESQDYFWKNISPDIRAFLDDFESRETWAYSYNEIPDVFIEISEMMPRINMVAISESEAKEVRDFVHQIIMLLANLPLRQAMCCIAYLDRRITVDNDIGWAVLIYMETASVTKKTIDHPNYSQYKLMYVRINLLLQSRVSTLLFTQLLALGDKK